LWFKDSGAAALDVVVKALSQFSWVSVRENKIVRKKSR
jgi:hypothetical protein